MYLPVGLGPWPLPAKNGGGPGKTRTVISASISDAGFCVRTKPSGGRAQSVWLQRAHEAVWAAPVPEPQLPGPPWFQTWAGRGFLPLGLERLSAAATRAWRGNSSERVSASCASGIQIELITRAAASGWLGRKRRSPGDAAWPRGGPSGQRPAELAGQAGDRHCRPEMNGRRENLDVPRPADGGQGRKTRVGSLVVTVGPV